MGKLLKDGAVPYQADFPGMKPFKQESLKSIIGEHSLKGKSTI